MNPVIEELKRRSFTTVPSWANRAAVEIERLEAKNAELFVSLDRAQAEIRALESKLLEREGQS